ncbi:MAG: penicillin acylase family protein [Microthrixaceae bacterium]
MRDVNDGNDRFLGQYLAMDRATSVGDLRAAVHEHQGLPWVNVIAADRHGDVWYCDASPTPNLSDEVSHAFDRAVDEDPLTALFFSQRVALLNGSDPATEWIDDGARQPGAVPPDRLPELTTDTVAFNSNDPYWVAHPELRVDRGPVLAGLYGRPLSPRTRMNATVLSGAAPTGPSGPEGRWTHDDLERALLDNRSLLAEQLLDGVVDRCRSAGVVERGSSAFDLGAIADLLAGWDRAFDLTSVGAVVWREFLGGFSNDDLRKAGPLYAEPFDPERATLTPSGLAPAPESGTDPIVTRMVDALVALDRAGVAYATRCSATCSTSTAVANASHSTGPTRSRESSTSSLRTVPSSGATSSPRCRPATRSPGARRSPACGSAATRSPTERRRSWSSGSTTTDRSAAASSPTDSRATLPRSTTPTR